MHLVINIELAILWNLFESLQSRSSDKYGLDKDIFFTYINITVKYYFIRLSFFKCYRDSGLSVYLIYSQVLKLTTKSKTKSLQFRLKNLSYTLVISNRNLIIILESICRGGIKSLDKVVFDIFDLANVNEVSVQDVT